MAIGIYKITNLVNGKCYIGQSVDIEKRWDKERTRAFNNTANEYNCPRSYAFRKYGLENFTFEIIEECCINQLNEKERYYIQYYNSVCPNGYNQTLGGYSSVSQKLQLDQIEDITHLLQTTKLTNIEIAKFYGVSENTICGINTGYYWRRDNIDYPIRKNSKAKVNHCIDCGAEISINAKRCLECDAKSKQVINRPNPKQLAQEIMS